MVTLDDLEIDFEGAVVKMYEEARAEVEAIPADQRDTHFLLKGLDHLASMIRLDAPPFLLEMARKSLLKRLRKWRPPHLSAAATQPIRPA